MTETTDTLCPNFNKRYSKCDLGNDCTCYVDVPNHVAASKPKGHPMTDTTELAPLPNEAELVSIIDKILTNEPTIRGIAPAIIAALRPFLNADKRVLTMADFPSDGNEEDRWIYDCENGCPSCGGSGHKDDCFPKSDGKRIAELEAALESTSKGLENANVGWQSEIKRAERLETALIEISNGDLAPRMAAKIALKQEDE